MNNHIIDILLQCAAKLVEHTNDPEFLSDEAKQLADIALRQIRSIQMLYQFGNRIGDSPPFPLQAVSVTLVDNLLDSALARQLEYDTADIYNMDEPMVYTGAMRDGGTLQWQSGTDLYHIHAAIKAALNLMGDVRNGK